MLLGSSSAIYATEPDGSSAVVFMYHRFGEDKYPSTNIKISQFIEQLDFLKHEGFSVWPLSKIERSLRNKIPFPDKVVAITIDDAYLSVYQHAFPILKKRKLPFTVFISSENVDKKFSNYMTWQQLREMQNNGMEAGNHSAHHEHLIRTNKTRTVWKKDVLADILLAQNRIKEELDVDAKLFAYPYGEFSEELADLVSSLGLSGFGQQSGAIGSYSDRRYYPRFPISESYSGIQQFKEKAYSLSLPLVDIKPRESVWLAQASPKLRLGIASFVENINRTKCFASGKGAIEINFSKNNYVVVEPRVQFQSRRFRYNCTLPSDKPGRYYWYSHLWINPNVPEG